VPEGWPDALRPPSDAQLVTSTSDTDSNGGPEYTLSFLAPGTTAQVAGSVKQQLKGAGYTVDDDSEHESTGSSGSTTRASISAHNAKYDVKYSITQGDETTTTEADGPSVLVAVDITSRSSSSSHSTTTY
jgi:hypothetical protein